MLPRKMGPRATAGAPTPAVVAGKFFASKQLSAILTFIRRAKSANMYLDTAKQKSSGISANWQQYMK